MKSRGQNNFGSDRRRDRVASRPVVFAAVIVAVLVLIQFAFPNAFSSVFSYFFSSAWSGDKALSSDLTPKQQLMQENAALQQQLELYQGEASSSKAVADENAELRSLLGRPAGTQDLILASVLKRPPGAGYDYLILDAGTADGVAVGDPIYLSDDIALGQIVEADPHTSKAELYSSPGTSYDVLIGADHIPATAVGQGGGSFAATVSREAGVLAGDEVVIPGIQFSSSAASFGSVEAVISDPAQPFAKILFAAPVNPYGLDFVLVGTGPGRPRPFAGTTTSATSTAS